MNSNSQTSTGMAATLALVVAQIAPLPAVLAPIAAAPAAAQAQRIRINCYSNGYAVNQCRLPQGTQQVTFLGPDRSGQCREGSTWGQRQNQLWVSGGCGGTFEAIAYQGGGNQGGNWGGNQGEFASQLTCRSVNNRPQTCSANTDNRVQLIQQLSQSPCIEGQSWRYNRNSITVRDGCSARFAYGAGTGGGWTNPGGNQGGNWGGNPNQGFAGQLDCRSENNRSQSCNVFTNNRVQLIRQFSQTQCIQGRNWGYDRNRVWVTNGCQARFGYGYGNQTGDFGGGSSSGGSNAGGIVAGGLLAAGLIALLASAGKGKSPSSGTTAQSATVDADFNRFPADARTSAQACMTEAARQIGATGGTRVRLTDVDGAQRSGDGWMILGRLSATYDSEIQPMTMDCRATGSKVTAFEVR